MGASKLLLWCRRAGRCCAAALFYPMYTNRSSHVHTNPNDTGTDGDKNPFLAVATSSGNTAFTVPAAGEPYTAP